MPTAAEDARIDIANRALLKLGLPASYSIDDENDLGATVDKCWAQTEAFVFSLYDWTWAKATVALAQHATTPVNGWSYGFDLPAGRIGEPLAILDQAGQNERKLRDYHIENSGLYANTKPLWGRWRFAVSPDTWDIGFALGFVVLLAAEMAVPLTQDDKLAADLRREAVGTPSQEGAGGIFGRLYATHRAGSQTGRDFMADNPLLAARA